MTSEECVPTLDDSTSVARRRHDEDAFVLDNAYKFFALAREREAIRRRRAAGEPWPWTTDQILSDWSFCNVHRENDRTTVWFREQVRSHLAGWPAVEATVAFRWFNLIETGERISDLLLNGWDRDEAFRRLAPVRDAGEQLWSAAYRLRGETGRNKLDSYLDAIEAVRRGLPGRAARWGNSLREAWLDLQDFRLMGPLTAYEVVSDLRWTPVLANATDIMTWASVGAGCANGMEWVLTGKLGDHDSSPGEVPALVEPMRQLLAMSRDPQYWPYADAPWEMREVEHWACETAKYVKAKYGRRLKRRYQQPEVITPDLFTYAGL